MVAVCIRPTNHEVQLSNSIVRTRSTAAVERRIEAVSLGAEPSPRACSGRSGCHGAAGNLFLAGGELGPSWLWRRWRNVETGDSGVGHVEGRRAWH